MMHLLKLLLPVLYVTFTFVSGFECNGVSKSNICCADGCGECGGSGCSNRGGGLTGDDCCHANILANGVVCSDSVNAPCIMDDDASPTPTTPTPSSSDYTYVGCFTDSKTRVLSGKSTKKSTVMTTEYCAGLCEGSTYFGTQWGVECFCSASGDDPDELGDGTCDMDCVGDSSETCGGYYSISVYQYGNSPVPSPVSSVPTPTTSPTPVMSIPSVCGANDPRPAFRYAASTGVAGRLYAEGAGCFTLTDLYEFRSETDGSPKGPLYMLDTNNDEVLGAATSVTKKWLLKAELYITGGGIFYCIGSSKGGDCDELRIQSDGPDAFHEVRGHGGSMYYSHTIVTSWDTSAKQPQETHEGGRSFLNCVSEKLTGETCEGQAKNEMGECRMDIINSEVGYLGWFDSESYGITWKVRGFCTDLSNPDVFETTNVYGDILNSDIHHNYYGHYSYGHQGGVWDNNKMHDNWQYGFDPHDDSDYLTISNNEVYNNVNHGIIASKRCNNVKIFNNVIYDGGPEAVGVFLHRSSDYAEVYGNQITNMADAGIALLESFGADIHDNVIDGAEFGIRMSLGSGSNQVYDNTFNGCTKYGVFTYMGSDPPDVSDGRPAGNIVDNNVFSNTAIGVKIKESDNTVLTNNAFPDATELEFYDAHDTTWSGNTLPAGVCINNVVEDNGISVPESTFADASGLPSTEC